MNWVLRPELTEFYQTGIAKLEENKKMQQAQAIVDDGSVKSASTISTAFLEKPNRQKSYPVGDDMRFKTSVQDRIVLAIIPFIFKSHTLQIDNNY